MKAIQFRFDEQKAVAAATWFIQRAKGEMNYLALMKLLYLADREALVRFGHPITGDRVVAMKNGPVLSRIFDFVSQKKQNLPKSLWHSFIPRPMPFVFTVKLEKGAQIEALSKGEIALLDEIFSKFCGMTEWDLVEFTHQLPEWKKPKGKSAPISFEEVLKAAGASAKDIAAIAENAAVDTYLDNALAKVS
jgi:uncharacterized phage-associated protein